MLGFDLMDSQAGKDIYDMGLTKGRVEGLRDNAKEMLIDALDARFGLISTDLVDRINAIHDSERLKGLHREAMRCQDLDSFKKRLLS